MATYRFIGTMLIAFALPALSSLAAEPIIGIASVIDADTFELHGTRIRLVRIDAPESGQLCQDDVGKNYSCGQKAALALAEHVGPGTLACDPLDRDRYGRTVAVCHLGSEDIGAWLVESGLAVAYRDYSLDYVAAEDQARIARRGIWAGTFQMPWDWRKAH